MVFDRMFGLPLLFAGFSSTHSLSGLAVCRKNIRIILGEWMSTDSDMKLAIGPEILGLACLVGIQIGEAPYVRTWYCLVPRLRF